MNAIPGTLPRDIPILSILVTDQLISGGVVDTLWKVGHRTLIPADGRFDIELGFHAGP